MIPLEDCDYHCTGCGLVTCRDERPSPAEDQRTCPDCFEFAAWVGSGWTE